MSESKPKIDMADNIIAWESGDLGTQDTVEFFAELIKNGMAWKLQGCYGRAAMRMIESGVLDKEGNINQDLLDEVVAESSR